MTDYNDIRNRLIQARKVAGLSQTDVAKHLYLSESGFADIENRRPSMSVDRLLKLTALYGVSIEWVMTGVNPNFDTQAITEAVAEATAHLAHLQETISQYRRIA